MTEIVEMLVAEGVVLNVAVTPEIEELKARASGEQGGPVQVASVGRVKDQLLEALDATSVLAQTAGKRFDASLTSGGPEEVTLEFGIAVGCKAGVVLTSASVDGHIKVSMKWKRVATDQ